MTELPQQDVVFDHGKEEIVTVSLYTINGETMEASTKVKYKTVEQYIEAQPRAVRPLLQEIRETIRAAAPEATEVISYNMPAFKQQGILIWYAGFKEHIGIYPRPSAIKAFAKELSIYKGAKGSVQFPLGEPMPLALIGKMVKFRLKEDSKKQ